MSRICSAFLIILFSFWRRRRCSHHVNGVHTIHLVTALSRQYVLHVRFLMAHVQSRKRIAVTSSPYVSQKKTRHVSSSYTTLILTQSPHALQPPQDGLPQEREASDHRARVHHSAREGSVHPAAWARRDLLCETYCWSRTRGKRVVDK